MYRICAEILMSILFDQMKMSRMPRFAIQTKNR